MLQEFREERDKLVSGLEAILKKKDVEIKQHKDLIIQLKEREAELTKVQVSLFYWKEPQISVSESKTTPQPH